MDAMDKTSFPACETTEAVRHTRSFFLLTSIAIILPLTWHLYREYKVYLSLGPGGTPPTLAGFLRVKVLGLFALSDPYTPRQLPEHQAHESGYLREPLPPRTGPRPEVRGIAPQRQVTQKSGEAIYQTLAFQIECMAASRESMLSVGTSCFEKHGTGLFSTIATVKSSPNKAKCKGEVVHIHGSDGSMHTTLHPADAKVVLEAGWGERHPLARGGVFEKFVPADFMMVYSARSDEEIEVVLRIIRAAAWFVAGQKGGAEGFDEGEMRRDSGYVSEGEEKTVLEMR